jgi:hypothetical protein
MKKSWKKVISGIALAAILAGHTGVAEAGKLGSAVRKAAGSAISSRSGGSGSGSSLVRRAAGAVQNFSQNGGNGGLANRVVDGAKNVVNSRVGNVLGTAQEIVNNSDSLAVKALAKVVTDPNSLTARVIKRIDNVDSNSLAGKLIDRASGGESLTSRVLSRVNNADSNSLTGKIINKAKIAAADPTSLTGRVLARAQTNPNSLTGKILNKAVQAVENQAGGTGPAANLVNQVTEAVADTNKPAGRVFDRAKLAIENGNQPANKLLDRVKQAVAEQNVANGNEAIVPPGRVFDRVKQAVAEGNANGTGALGNRLKDKVREAIEKNGGVEQVVAEAVNGEAGAEGVVDAVVGAVVEGAAPADAVNANGQLNPVVGQLLNAGIQAGGQVLSTAIANRQQGFVGGGFAPAAVTVAVESIAPVAPVEVAPIAAPVATPDATTVSPLNLELSDLRFVDNGNEEQGPMYRLMVSNRSTAKVESKITVALLASMEKDSNDNLSVVGSLESIEGGATKSVDLRLPKGSQVLTFLTAVVAVNDAADADETDNVVTVERDSVRLAH